MLAKEDHLRKVKKGLKLGDIRFFLENLKDKEILVIGDTIIDQYVFVRPKGRAIKDPILSVGYRYHETYAGGILAIANHVADFVKRVKLITLVGDKNDKSNFIAKSLKDNVELSSYIKPDSHAIVKKRYIDEVRGNKLFKVEYMNDRPIPKELTEKIVNILDQEIHQYDAVLVGDFGHGFINREIRRELEKKSKFLAINAQSNSANMGYNYFTHYEKMDFVTMDEDELRMPLYKRFEDIDDVIEEAYKKFGYEKFLITSGKRGCQYVEHGKIFKAPALTENVTDTVGAGDAVFSVSSLLLLAGAKGEVVPFVANCAGAIAVNIMGNKESICKKKLIEFIENELK